MQLNMPMCQQSIMEQAHGALDLPVELLTTGKILLFFLGGGGGGLRPGFSV